MIVNLEPIKAATRLLWNVPLVPVQGTRFQPTGFPDLGAATYQAGAVDCLLVESAQSMANRLEATAWDGNQSCLVSALSGLSYVAVRSKAGAHLTSSIEEAHRLNSVYIEKADGGAFKKKLEASLGADKKSPVNRKKFTEGLLKLDANSLLHGVFLESIDGRLRVARALSAFIEATGVTIAASGGVKNDRVRAETDKKGEAGDKSEKQDAAAGFGNVPFQREEYCAKSITAYFSVDVAQVVAYPLPACATDLLLTLALWKIRRLLDGDLRLRTACDLAVAPGYDFAALRPTGYVLPSGTALDEAVRASIAACTAQGCFAEAGGVTTVVFDK